MTLQGTIQNGVVVLQEGAQLPNGTPVTVLVESAAIAASAPTERLSTTEFERVRAILNEIASLPSENPGDTFRGSDHDRVLYGEP
jgi:hypothetical protein